MEKINVSESCVLIKTWDVDREKKETSEGGIITASQFKPLQNTVGVGTAVSVGSKIFGIKKGDIVLYKWTVEDMPERYLGRDDTGEYRIVRDMPIGGQIYGVIKNPKRGYSHIVPKKYYVLAEPLPKDLEITNSIFQIPISAVNPNDDIVRQMGLGVGDWILCEPNSAHAIMVNRKVFWFIFLELIIAVNKGQHRVAIKRKYVSPTLRLASRKNLVELN